MPARPAISPLLYQEGRIGDGSDSSAAKNAIKGPYEYYLAVVVAKKKNAGRERAVL